MFSMHPIFLIETILGAWVYSIHLRGRKGVQFNLWCTIPILVLTTILNPLFTHDGVTILFYLNDNAVTVEAVLYGLASGVMLCGVIIWFSCYSMIVETDKFIYLFGRIAPTTALLLTMIIRFIPLIKKRFQEIHNAQKCIGRQKISEAWWSRFRQLSRELSILVAWSLETSIETSDSMEARGYGLHGRTSFHLYIFTKRDALLLIGIFMIGAIAIAGCIMGKTDIYYYPHIWYPETDWITYMSGTAYAVLLLIPIWIDKKGECKWKQLLLKM